MATTSIGVVAIFYGTPRFSVALFDTVTRLFLNGKPHVFESPTDRLECSTRT